MAIIINNFEAVAETPNQTAQKQDADDKESPTIPEPQDLALVLHYLATQALRSWAH
ncbi:MAG: hypothetical protein ACXWT1_04470 [Methylobacter sp.]